MTWMRRWSWLMVIPMLWGGCQCVDTTKPPDAELPGAEYFQFDILHIDMRVRDAYARVLETVPDLLLVGDGGLALRFFPHESGGVPFAHVLFVETTADLGAVTAYGDGDPLVAGPRHGGSQATYRYRPGNLGGLWEDVLHDALGDITDLSVGLACTGMGEVLAHDFEAAETIHVDPTGRRLDAIALIEIATASRPERFVAVGVGGAILHRGNDDVIRDETIAGGPDFVGVSKHNTSTDAGYELVAVGGNEVWVWSDGAWTLVFNGTLAPLTDVDSDSEFGEIWASGQGGYVLRRSEIGAWVESFVPGEPDLAMIEYEVEGGLYVVTDDDRILWADEASWVDLEFVSRQAWADFHASSEGVLFAAAGDGLQRKQGIHWDLAAETPMGIHLRRLHVVRGDLVYAVGGVPDEIDDFLLRWDGADWSILHQESLDRFTDVWADATGDTVFATAEFGSIWRDQGQGWEITPTDAGTTNINALDGGSPRDLVAVGDGGAILRYDGEESWSGESSGTAFDLHAIHGSVAVGAGGTVLTHDGSAWSATTLEGAPVLNDVRVVGGGEIWVVGDEAMVYRHDGAEWTRLVSDLPGIDLLAVGEQGARIWIGGTDGLLMSGERTP